jgi:50S ribosomal protein L16 3-hydroxylase
VDILRFQDFDSAAFLADYWQKKPCLIRNPFTCWTNPLEPDELAGLACEDHIESRLITHERDALKAEHGPLPEERFSSLGKAPWTLLVQAVDHHIPAVAALIEPFRFIPNWRIDDVMVSYATDGGGVGPHFDQYDVFLIQGLGTRRWRVGQHCNGDSVLLPHDDLRLLADFETTDEWLLEPGDMLYVPPGIAHDGVAVGDDCMTYSIGFRAPSRAELIGHFADDVLETLVDEDRYSDAGLATQTNPGEITADTLSALHTMITEKLADPAAFARWFGGYNSTPKYPDIDWRTEEVITERTVKTALVNGTPLTRNPASRFSFVRQESGVLLFVDGQCFECAGEVAGFAETLCAKETFTVDPAPAQSGAIGTLITQLMNQGSIGFADGEND